MVVVFSVHKSQPLVYAQISFFLTNLTTTEDIINTVVVSTLLFFGLFFDIFVVTFM